MMPWRPRSLGGPLQVACRLIRPTVWRLDDGVVIGAMRRRGAGTQDCPDCGARAMSVPQGTQRELALTSLRVANRCDVSAPRPGARVVDPTLPGGSVLAASACGTVPSG